MYDILWLVCSLRRFLRSFVPWFCAALSGGMLGGAFALYLVGVTL